MTTKREANYREAEGEDFRCGHCQFMAGFDRCHLVEGMIDSYDVCDLYSGHRPWQ